MWRPQSEEDDGLDDSEDVDAFGDSDGAVEGAGDSDDDAGDDVSLPVWADSLAALEVDGGRRELLAHRPFRAARRTEPGPWIVDPVEDVGAVIAG